MTRHCCTRNGQALVVLHLYTHLHLHTHFAFTHRHVHLLRWRTQADRLEASVVAANGAAEFTVDLVERSIAGPDGLRLSFEISEAERTRLLEGLDDIGLTLKQRPEIEAWEKRMAAEMPWAQIANASAL